MLFTNYVTSAWRNILRHKLFSIINILGLAIGLAAVMLITLYVRFETSYDTFWKHADNIYRISMFSTPPGMAPYKFTRVGAPVVHVLKREFPQIEYATRVDRLRPILSFNGEYHLDDIDLVDPDISNIFDFNVLAGDIVKALSSKNGLVLNQTRAKKYFGEEDPLGKVVTIDFDHFQRDFEVLALIEDIPLNSQLDITSMIILDEEVFAENSRRYTAWFGPFTHTYFKLKNGMNISNINEQMPTVIDRDFPMVDMVTSGFKNTDRLVFNSLNIQDLHLKAEGIGEYRERGSMSAIINFSIVAAIILVIASINFMNLSTARSSTRAKEISLRKLAGASKEKLVTQYIGEAIIFSLIALFFAVCILEAILPFFNDFLSLEISLEYSASHILIFISLSIVVGAVAGYYPALILSKFRPSEILKSGHNKVPNISGHIRTSLVVIQFAASITLFTITAVVYSQILYTANKDLGFNEENLILVEGISNKDVRSKISTIINELTRQDQFDSAAPSFFTPGNTSEIVDKVRTDDMEPGEVILINIAGVGYDFFKTYDIKLISGRTYDQTRNEMPASNQEILNGVTIVGSVMINQSSLDVLGFKTADDAIGQLIYVNADRVKAGLERSYRVIGVTEDSHYYSLKRSVPPVLYYLSEFEGKFLTIRYNGNIQNAVKNLNTVWQHELPKAPLKISHVSDLVDAQYRNEAGEATMFASFSALAIFIASLGLFGLASFTSERRTKEIGIRKVFGAEVWQIVRMLVFQFSKPVLIANFIAWPVAYLAMSRWLESFVYRIDDTVIIALCLIAGITALLIAWATVAGNSYVVAKQSPIKALRHE